MNSTIMMIHGMNVNAECWANFKGPFEEKGYRCTIPTLRFHDMDPNSPPDPRLGTVGLLDYADDLEREIKQLDDVPILIGHSLGGLLAQILASRGLAKAAVLIAPSPPNGIRALKYSSLKAGLGIVTKWGFWKKPFRPSFKRVAPAAMHLLPPDLQKELYSKMVYESGRALFQTTLSFLDRSGASKVDEEKVKCPILAIAGKEDRVIPPALVRKMAMKYRKVSTYKEFDSHAHSLIGEPGWQEIAEYILKWLDQTLSKNRQ